MAFNRPKIAITMGDPAGIGPELCLRLLATPDEDRDWIPVVVGDSSVLYAVSQQCGRLPKLQCDVLGVDEYRQLDVDHAVVVQPDLPEDHVPYTVEPGQISAATGAAAHQFLMTGIQLAQEGAVAGITTGPLNKEALAAAGIRHPGHTEILAEATHTSNYCMMLTCEQITCSFVTTHVGYSDVPALLTTERILEVADLTVDAMWKIRGRAPRIVVCALNPHAGENGLFGNREEQRIIEPAIDVMRSRGVDVVGPLPPDTAFLPQRRMTTDAFICMYHDQGHIPIKAIAFDEAVNVTLGLPIVRTSVDHGTALDIAWQGIADPSSFLHAIQLATRLAAVRTPPSLR